MWISYSSECRKILKLIEKTKGKFLWKWERRYWAYIWHMSSPISSHKTLVTDFVENFGEPLNFSPGDDLGILPQNHPKFVQMVLSRLQPHSPLPDQPLSIEILESEERSYGEIYFVFLKNVTPFAHPCTLRTKTMKTTFYAQQVCEKFGTIARVFRHSWRCEKRWPII